MNMKLFRLRIGQFLLSLILLTTLLLVTGQSAGAADDDNNLLHGGFGAGFGRHGEASTLLNFEDVVSYRSVAIQPDGKIVVGGLGRNGQFAWLGRFDADGQLDQSFGGNGQIIASHLNEFTDIVVQSDDKIVAIARHGQDFAVVRYRANGSPDLDFSSDGQVFIDFDGEFDIPSVLFLQPDGKILVGGRAADCGIFDCNDDDFAIARLHPDGGMDTTFGGDGTVVFDLGERSEAVRTLAVEPTGHIVASGVRCDESCHLAIVRMEENGQLDRSFHGNGKLITDIVALQRATVVQSDGRIIVSKIATIGAAQQVELIRFNTDGSVDNSFGNNGKAIVPPSPTIREIGLGSLLELPDKALLFVGQTGAVGEFVVAKFNANGEIVSSFGDGGHVAHSFSEDDRLGDVAVDQNGGIIFIRKGDGDFFLSRLQSSGRLDSGDGQVYVNPSGFLDEIRDVLVEPDSGTIVAVGKAGITFDGQTSTGITVAQFRATGRLDTNFSQDGIRTDTAFPIGVANAAVFDHFGNILVAGQVKSATTDTDFDFVLQRYSPSGTALPFTGVTGDWPQTDVGGGSDVPRAIAIQQDGKIVMAGTSNINGVNDLTLVRYLPSGLLDPDFSGGMVTTDVLEQNSVDQLSDLVLLRDGKLLVLGRTAAAQNAGVTPVLLRYMPDGSLDTTFGNDNGVAIVHSGSKLAVQQDGKIIVGGNIISGNKRIITVARYHADGTIDNQFGSLGRTTVEYEQSVFGFDLLIEPSGHIVMVGTLGGGLELADQAIMTRLRPDGLLDASFSEDGRAVFTVNTTGAAFVHAIARDAETDDLVIAGTAGILGNDKQFMLLKVAEQSVENSAPVAIGESYTIGVDETLVAAAPGLLEYDQDADGDILTVSIQREPEFGSLTNSLDGAFEYLPEAGFAGFDSFAYRVFDGTDFSEQVEVTIHVTAEPFMSPLTVRTAEFSNAEGWHLDESFWSTVAYPDVNGDGRADVCGRATTGIYCAMATEADSFTPPKQWTPRFGNGDGWHVEEYYWSTIGYPDINGDGRADVCGRADVGIYCGLATDGDVFTEVIQLSPDFSNAAGWHLDESFWGTIQYPDVNGDGRDDVCGRGVAGVMCILAAEDAFGDATLWSNEFSDANGWQADPSYWGTIQFPDMNGDGRDDVCGRGPAGIYCELSSADGQANQAVPLSEFFADDKGWQVHPSFWETIQFADVNGDGAADVCGRATTGLYCGLYDNGTFAEPMLWKNFFGNEWHWQVDQAFWQTIQLADLNGDGMADVCGRLIDGLHCALSDGAQFGVVNTWQPQFGNRFGWQVAPFYWRTMQLVDVDGNGMADVCGRRSDGIVCATTLSNSIPVAADHSYEVQSGGELEVGAPGVLDKATDTDGHTLVAYLETEPTNGQVALLDDGGFSYEPADGFTGTDSFTFRASDGRSFSELAVATINVVAAGTNTRPTAVGDSYVIASGETLTWDAPGVMENDSDADGDTLTAVLEGGSRSGTLVLNADGSFVYTAPADFEGVDTFSYHVTDGQAVSESVAVVFEVTAEEPSQPPPPPAEHQIFLPLVTTQ